MKIRNVFRANRWCVAYRISNSEELNFSTDKTPFKLIKTPRNDWCADPFLLKKHGKTYIFCEYTNEKKSKSYIAYKELFPNEGKRWNVAYEFSGHTSYPCVFLYKSELYMIPETTFERNIVILKYDEEGCKWTQYAVLIKNINAPDTTFFIQNDEPYVFVYEIIERTNRKLHVCKLNDELNKIICDEVVKTYDCPDGRPGGNCILAKDGAIRIVQPGINNYGEKLVFKKFSFVDKKYIETDLFTVNPGDVAIDSKRTKIGLHTYNRNENIEVIDLLLKGKFDLFRPLKVLLKKTNFFGYGYYDAKRKYIFDNFKNK